MLTGDQTWHALQRANPVPDPDRLLNDAEMGARFASVVERRKAEASEPRTRRSPSSARSQAELLAEERSTDMDTRERAEVRPTQPARPGRAPAYALAAILIVIGAVVGIIVLATGGDDGPVAAAEAAPQIIFDGDNCVYEGPTLIEEGIAEVTLVNTGWQSVLGVMIPLPESLLAAELEVQPLGTERSLGLSQNAGPPGPQTVRILAESRSEGVGFGSMAPGTYIIDCVTSTGTHVWRSATTLEVVAP